MGPRVVRFCPKCKAIQKERAELNQCEYCKIPLEEVETTEEGKIVGIEGNTVIQALFDHALKSVHPAIGIVDNIAYVGLQVPSRFVDKQNNHTRDCLYFVTSSRELIPETMFAAKGWKLSNRPIKLPERWSLLDVQAFIEGTAPPVDPIVVLEHVEEAWHEYLEFEEQDGYLYNALWDIGTPFAHIFTCYPYDYKGGLRGTAKTKALTLSSCIAFNAIPSNNMSSSALFRLIQNGRCTLQIDETEKLRNPERAQDLRTLLLSGYKKGMPAYRVEKTGKDQFVPEPFEVYGPKRIANISGLEDVLEDRCIVDFMKRGITKAVDTELDIEDPKWSKIRSELYCLFLEHWHEVKLEYDRLTELGRRGELRDFLAGQLSGEKGPLDLSRLTARELEIWKPLIALALFFDSKKADGSYTDRLLRFAHKRMNEKVAENVAETGEMIVVQVLLDLVTMPSWKDDFVPISQIRENVAFRFEDEQKWLTNNWIGRALRRLKFLDKRHLGTHREIRIQRNVVVDLAGRYGITPSHSRAPKGAGENEGYKEE